jgi:hypothetical protein
VWLRGLHLLLGGGVFLREDVVDECGQTSYFDGAATDALRLSDGSELGRGPMPKPTRHKTWKRGKQKQ